MYAKFSDNEIFKYLNDVESALFLFLSSFDTSIYLTSICFLITKQTHKQVCYTPELLDYAGLLALFSCREQVYFIIVGSSG